MQKIYNYVNFGFFKTLFSFILDFSKIRPRASVIYVIETSKSLLQLGKNAGSLTITEYKVCNYPYVVAVINDSDYHKPTC